ncbi:MAG: putative bifunctional diguanylate cyclase/phosphodiesterase, partial [Pyrinomonadaceae bacterium]
PERFRKAHAAGMKRYVESGVRRISWGGIEVPVSHKNGHEIPAEISFGEFKREGRHYFTAVMRDVTERKRAAEALRKSEEYRNLFRHANDAILILDPENETVLDVNDKGCEVYGIEREDFIGYCLRDLSNDPARGERLLKELLGRGTRHEFESTQFRADGTAVHFLVNSSVIEYEGQRAILSINRDITDRKHAEERLLHDAFHDALTGLPNRALFVDHLQLAIERGRRHEGHLFAVLFLDLDRFKLVNDSLGHMTGDNLLVLAAQRLKEAVRPGDTVARLGGDEFTIMLEDLADLADAVRIAERIQGALAQPFALDGHEIFTSASIGVCVGGSGYERPEEVLRDADTAMYRAKALGKGRHEIFDKAMHAHALQQLRLESDMRRAVEREEFLLHYQPIVSLATGELRGFEALARWPHPQRGMISPTEFIPLAEETGLIIPLGGWVLRTACRQMRDWLRAHPETQNWTVSVNLSGKQFLQHDLADQVRVTLEEAGISPRNLKLEITETVLMENSAAAIATLDELRALGVELSIDDFGTGYSSLSYLHRLPVNTLKIDRSFIQLMSDGGENGEIVRTIVLLARSLGMDVVAEGVETSEQVELLKRLGSDYAQGYYYSRPVDARGAASL